MMASPAKSLSTVNTPTTPMASGTSSYEDDLRNTVFEGQLNKFTNVVKGWQYR